MRTLHNRIPAQITLAVAGSAVALTAVVSAVAAQSGTQSPGAAVTPAAVTPAAVGAAAGAGSAQATAASPAGLPATSPVIGAASTASVVLVAYSARRHHPTPRQIAKGLLSRFHWKRWQFSYLNRLWERESGWNKFASNPYSGAYGIPQAVPGSKMASAGPNWRSNARTQILWGMRYIKGRYRSPYQAWRHEVSYGWY